MKHRRCSQCFLLIFWAVGLGNHAFAAITNVTVVDFAFHPASVTVNVSDQVRWAWTGSAPHSTTSDGGLWNSGVNDTGFTFTNTFNVPGDFPYHCTVHSGMRASVTVNGDTPPIITVQPQDRTVTPGTNVTFTVTAIGNAPLNYQWQFNGSPISDATGSSLMLSNIQFVNAGAYSVVVGNPFGNTPSSNAVLTVSPVKGNYNGLFSDADNVTAQTSGSFSLATTTSRKFTAKLQMGSGRLSSTGQFDAAGGATNMIPRPNQTALTLSLHLDPTDADRLSGTVFDGTTTATLSGDRAVFDGRQHIAPQMGLYTMVIPGVGNSSSLPGGDSHGTATVDKSGKIRLTGSLADGTKISQTVPISKNGDWPLYVSLYGNLGAILGWISVVSTPDNDLHGDVVWLKPNIPTAKFYPAGFNLPTTAEGFAYHPPASTVNVLNFTNGTATFSGTDLAADFANLITIGARNKVTNQSSNRLSLTFKSATGAFSGRVTVPNSTQALPFSGVVLQPQQIGRGYFLGTTQSGPVSLGP